MEARIQEEIVKTHRKYTDEGRAREGRRKGKGRGPRRSKGRAKEKPRKTKEALMKNQGGVKEKLRKGWMAEGPRKSQVIDKKGPRKDQGRIKE